MKRKPNMSQGKITLYWENDREYSTQSFDNLGGAISYAECLRKNTRFEQGTSILGYWEASTGFRPSRKAADMVTMPSALGARKQA